MIKKNIRELIKPLGNVFNSKNQVQMTFFTTFSANNPWFQLAFHGKTDLYYTQPFLIHYIIYESNTSSSGGSNGSDKCSHEVVVATPSWWTSLHCQTCRHSTEPHRWRISGVRATPRLVLCSRPFLSHIHSHGLQLHPAQPHVSSQRRFQQPLMWSNATGVRPQRPLEWLEVQTVLDSDWKRPFESVWVKAMMIRAALDVLDIWHVH